MDSIDSFDVSLPISPQQFRMSTIDWREEIGPMLGLRREIRDVLNKVAKCFKETDEEFDGNFRHEFFEMIHAE